MDNLTISQRKKCMTSIRNADTKPELVVRKMLFHQGARYRLRVASLPGKPDIVLPKYKKVVFVNGCFWHQHEGCKKTVMPKTNNAYWKPKLDKNVSNQKIDIQELNNLGWQSYVVWECQTKDMAILKRYINKILL